MLVLGSFYSHQQLMNSMVKIPRQFETFLDVGLQGLCPWTLLGGVHSVFPGHLLYSLDVCYKKSLGKVTTFVLPPKFKSHFIYSWFKTSFMRLHFLSFTSQVFQ